MKSPGSNIGNGYYGYQSPPETANHAEESKPDQDFSEFLWMENEEEFEKQVISELEEQALMEQCLEQMLREEEEREQEETVYFNPTAYNTPVTALVGGGDSNRYQWNHVSERSQETPRWNGSGDPHSIPSSSRGIGGIETLATNLQNLQVRDASVSQSTLNPLAAEFVPGRSFQFQSTT